MSDYSQIKLIFSDIDGTLLPFSGKDLTATAKLIEELIQSGIGFIPCTGRGTGNIPPVILQVPGLRYAITANGGLITDLTSGEVLRERTVPRQLARRITAFLRHYNGFPYTYRRGLHYLDTKRAIPAPDGYNHSHDEWVLSAGKLDFDELLAEPESSGVDKMGFSTWDQDALDKIWRDIVKQDFYPELFVSTSGPWNVEINYKGADKGSAALWLAEHLGFSADQILTAGDNVNDIPMLKVAAVSLAPENAVPSAKEAATHIVPDCLEDGVEIFLRQLLPQGRGA